jgi:hypothetical protein
VTVVRPSRLQRDGLFGVLVAAFVLVLVRGLAGAQTTGGAVAVAVFAGGVTAILLWAWIAAIMRPARLEITDQAVTLVDGRGKRTVLSRESGAELRVVVSGGGRARRRCLTIDGSGTVIPLGFFSLTEIQRQCTAAGWRLSRPGGRLG